MMSVVLCVEPEEDGGNRLRVWLAWDKTKQDREINGYNLRELMTVKRIKSVKDQYARDFAYVDNKLKVFMFNEKRL